MHLNKNGWGFGEMMVLLGILACFLLIAIYYIYIMYNNFDKEVNINYYQRLEEKLENQALIYLNEHYDENLMSDKVTINKSVLDAYGLGVSLEDKQGYLCKGYVIANKSKGVINKKAYISCRKYETDGYEEWRN